jgi:hypothetical protein
MAESHWIDNLEESICIDVLDNAKEGSIEMFYKKKIQRQKQDFDDAYARLMEGLNV